MTDRYVYLYRITLSKEGEDPLYYFGIRYAFEGRPEDDDYMGSPETHKNFWEDSSYIKTKEIIKSGSFSCEEELQEYAKLEIDMIKEAWNMYGVYSKGGKCLNAQAGRVFIHTEETRKKISEWSSNYWTGNPNHPMKRPEVAAKQAKSMSKFLLENPDRNPNNLPGVKEKQRKATTENNPMHRPEIRAKITGVNNPMYGKKHSEEKKKQISESLKKTLNKSEYKKLYSEQTKKRWEDPEYREKLISSHKKRWAKWRKERQTNSLENYFD